MQGRLLGQLQVGQEFWQQGVKVLLAFPDVFAHADQDVLGRALVDDDRIEDHPDKAPIGPLDAEHLNGLRAARPLGLLVDDGRIQEAAEAGAVFGMDVVAGIGVGHLLEVDDDVACLPEGRHALDDVERFPLAVDEVDAVVDEHEVAEDVLVLVEGREVLVVGDVGEACEHEREIRRSGNLLGVQAQVLAILDKGHVLFADAVGSAGEQRHEFLAHRVACRPHVLVEFLAAARARCREDLLVGIVRADNLGIVFTVLEDGDRSICDEIDESCCIAGLFF